MYDFLGPFFFGMSWLALALAGLWLLTRRPSHALALRAPAARVLAWTLVVLTLSTFVAALPFSLGFCRGGFDDPLRCSVLPVALVAPTSILSLLLAMAGLVATPPLAAGALILELVKRR